MMSQSDTALLVQLQWRLFNRRKISLILSTGVNGVRFVDMHISSVNVNASLVQSLQQRRSRFVDCIVTDGNCDQLGDSYLNGFNSSSI